MDNRPENDVLSQGIERYLELLERHLYGADPGTIAETLEEIRQHLTASCEGLMRKGYSVDEAVQLTLKRFGRTDKVGQNLARQLSPRSAQFKVYSMLIVSRYVKFIALILAGQNALGLAQSWLERVVGAVAAALLLMFVDVLKEFRRSLVQPTFIKRQILRKEEIQGAWNRLEIPGVANHIYLYLSFLLPMGIGSIREHFYAWAVFFFTEAAEHIYIKVAATRVSASMAA